MTPKRASETVLVASALLFPASLAGLLAAVLAGAPLFTVAAYAAAAGAWVVNHVQL